MFMPLAILLGTRGDQILTRWVGKDFATHSAPVCRSCCWVTCSPSVRQFSSGMSLTGAGKHQRYARGMLAEAIVVIVCLWFVVPHKGIAGAAWVATGAMIANRGMFAPWLICREIGIPWPHYMRMIYIGPLLAALPPAALSILLAHTLLPGEAWPPLIAHGIIICIVYAGLAWMLCVEREHKTVMQSWIRHRLRQGTAATAANPAA